MTTHVYFDPKAVKIESENLSLQDIVIVDGEGKKHRGYVDHGRPFMKFIRNMTIFVPESLVPHITLCTSREEIMDPQVTDAFESGDYELDGASARLTKEDRWWNDNHRVLVTIDVSAPTVEKAQHLLTEILRGRGPTFPFRKSKVEKFWDFLNSVLS